MLDLDSSAPGAGSMEKPYLFVSYARKDGFLVYSEVARLQRSGYRLWCDRRDIRTTQKWLDEIKKAIRECDGFLIFLSEASAASVNVREELEEALKFARVVIPVYIEKVRLPPEMRGKIGAIQGLEFYLLRKSEYENNLSTALFDCIGHPRPPSGLDRESVRELGVIHLPPPPTKASALPKVVFFFLIVTAGYFGIFGLVGVFAFAASFFVVLNLGDPDSFRLGGLATGFLCWIIASVLAGAAFAIHRIYLRRADG